MDTKVAMLTTDTATNEVLTALRAAGLRDHYSRVFSHNAGPSYDSCIATVILVRVGGVPMEIARVLWDTFDESAEIVTGQFSVSVFRPKVA